MQSLDAIKRRIKIVNTTAKITGAMKLVAIAKVKKQSTEFKVVSDFCQDFYPILDDLASGVIQKSIYPTTNSNKSLWILITSSLGLCGAYNINACKHLLSKIAPEDDIATIGKKGYAYLKARNYINRIVSVNEVSDVNIDYMEILPTSDLAIKHFNDGKYKQIHLIYTKFINALTFEPTSIQLLPLDVNLFKPQTTQQKSRYVSLTTDLKEIEYEPSKLAIIKSALPTFVSSAIFAAVTESKVCESGSRRNAMEAASDNAKQLISDLTLQYNRARQENITQEINEIVAGAGELG